MKKITLFSLFCFIPFLGVSAQDSLQVNSGADSFKAGRGNVATELNVNPFRGDIAFNNALNQVKFRYFASDGLAIRLAFAASSVRNQVNNTQPYGTNPTTFEHLRKSGTWGLNFGLEKHFTGTRRLSPYIGAELTFTNKSSSDEIVNGGVTTKVKGAWVATSYTPGFPPSTSYTERGFIRFGANLVSGFDFYMARNFFLGYEFTLGFASTRFKDVDVSTIYSAGTSPGGNSNNVKNDERSFSAGPGLINGIRIGYVF